MIRLFFLFFNQGKISFRDQALSLETTRGALCKRATSAAHM
jgi:hypothetical protein